ncbi:transporter substrate-binding domain-containing protein [Marinagarivorans algicola]|uniref:transporter substrate-binding domain-containing protein n=1 Tax=Marinagarivorans algicola TaxID=1513270 RepID=UPI00373664A5
MKKLLIMAASLLVLANTANAKNKDVIRAGVDAPYPPFEYKAPDGSLTGFEIELGNEVCKEITGKDCEWVVQAWDGLIPGLLARKYDMIFSSMSINDERKKRVLFSNSYYTTPSAYFSATNFDPTASKGKRIGVQRATIQDTYITEFLTDAEVVRYTTADDMALDLESGRLDAMFVDAPVGMGIIKEGSKIVQVGELVKEPVRIFGNGVGAAFRKRDAKLEAQVSAALETIKKNGKYDEIMKRYFDFDIKI